MSGPVHPSDDHAHGALHDAGASHGSVKSYLVGFFWAVLLTVIPFALAMTGFFPAGVTAVVAAVLAAVQIVVHLVYFLHMDRSATQRWNVLVFVFTVLVIGIVIVGSLWVMHNMNANMMH
ncbi:cytochrome o ubiquinol oxidase subunit IV [Pseudoxanthomonas spadix]|jgi:cytochrome o ubiquinol oxidase operon protein cyoD|uniref:cytochrome o ubiquinol oxidase subunit IV n=1 Tax=Pseudoxanthomonas spadix TaxID=415229 RepID=UPI000EFDBE77|nr:cytochrome o ubiquinol oxidase subunit IV [Pseudoxanthomonas spadix]MBP3973758.1 cytochrome o ubiquinol oxidase subunit IV [Pseudoxanthomonas spadix]RMW98044.1 cytochrome o ubiquinol oxidase subunit IV [Pseudoxanthomonas spadix]